MKRAQKALLYLVTLLNCLFTNTPIFSQLAATQAAPVLPPSQDPVQTATPARAPAQQFNPQQPNTRLVSQAAQPQPGRRKRQRPRSQARSQARSMAELTKEQKSKIKRREPRRTHTQPTRATRNVLNTVYLEQFLDPWRGLDETETFQLNFENRQLRDFLKFVENTLKITFILPDDFQPEPAGYDPVGNTKITFESQFPMNRKQIWDLTLTFLDMLNFAPVPTSEARTYQVIQSGTSTPGRPSANREPLPTFIGTDPDFLPDNDAKIRYVYFVENAELQTIRSVIETMKSSFAGPLVEFPSLRAIIMTDKASNIKSLTKILRELDQVAMPETLAIIKLTRADAQRVALLYNELIGKAGPGAQQPPFNPFLGGQRRPTSTQYFTPATRVFAEPRSNSLIVLGTRENVQRVEDFIVKEIDREIALPFSPLHIIQLRYIQAEPIAATLNEIIQGFNRATPENINASQYGGIRDGNKFFRPTVRVTAEPTGNRLIINADYEEYLKLREVIERLDVEQPQVAIKVLILNVDLTDITELGTQLRNKVNCCDGTGGADSVLGTNINFQTSGPATGPIIQRTLVPGPQQTAVTNGAERLLGNLIALATNQPLGTTLVTLGQDFFGVWGIVKALETYTKTSIIANPYLITTHKYKAEVSVGETRRVLGSQVISGEVREPSFVDIAANLTVSITPQISYDDTIALSIYVDITQFTDLISGNRLIKRLNTEALLTDKEVLALGGLIRDNVNEVESKVPILGDIPLIGWLFKSKVKTVQRSSLLILLSPEIIRPLEPEAAHAFTQLKINDAKYTLFSMESHAERRDPIHRFIFRDNRDKESSQIDKFISTQERYIDESQKKIAVPLALNNTPKKSLVDLVKPDTDEPKKPKDTQKAPGVPA